MPEDLQKKEPLDQRVDKNKGAEDMGKYSKKKTTVPCEFEDSGVL